MLYAICIYIYVHLIQSIHGRFKNSELGARPRWSWIQMLLQIPKKEFTQTFPGLDAVLGFSCCQALGLEFGSMAKHKDGSDSCAYCVSMLGIMSILMRICFVLMLTTVR